MMLTILFWSAVIGSLAAIVRYYIQKQAYPAQPYRHCPRCGALLPNDLSRPCVNCGWIYPKEPNFPWVAALFLFLCLAVVVIGAIAETYVAPSAAPISTTVPYATTYYIRQTQTARAYFPAFTTLTAVAKQPDCYRWDQVTIHMKGKTVCVKGVIYSIYSTPQTYTRIKFSDQPNTFFLYSVNYEFYDQVTGKSIKTGDCVSTTGTVNLIQGVPYIEIEDLYRCR